jgi:hypothetical protein
MTLDLFVASHNDRYQLRSNDRKLYLTNTNFMKNSFSYLEDRYWISLPAEIVDIYDQLSLYSFKTLINRQYKDFGEIHR